MKIKCARCKTEKEDVEFIRRKVNSNTFYSYCRPCKKELDEIKYQKKKRSNEFNFI